MFLTINNEVIWSLSRQSMRHVGVAHHWTALIFYNITRCYGKHVAVFAVAVAAGDIIKYQSFVYGSFVWGNHVRYNNYITSGVLAR